MLVVRMRFTLAPFQEFGIKLEISGSVPPPGLIPASAYLHCSGVSSQFCFAFVDDCGVDVGVPWISLPVSSAV